VEVLVDRKSKSVFATLNFASLFPSYDRILFLDADITVHADLTPLWETDLGDNPIAAVPDGNIRVLGDDIEDCESHGLNPGALYFNSGVVLFNLKQWREENWESALREIASNPTIKRKFHDQSFLNIAFSGKWLELPSRWNLKCSLRPYLLNKVPLHPKVLHMAHIYKPWLFPEKGARGLIRLFYDYLNLTTWKQVKQETPKFENKYPIAKEAYLTIRYYLGELGLDWILRKIRSR
jgi:lipopolysaccharide biosynthesis glycosyltransferase